MFGLNSTANPFAIKFCVMVHHIHQWHVKIIIMYIYHALINALSAHMIHINLNMIFYTHVEHSPTKTKENPVTYYNNM